MKPEKIIRKVKSVSEAQKILEKFVLPDTKTFTNESANISACLTKKSIAKMGSDKAVKKSTSPLIHAQALANIDILYITAPIHITHPDRKNEINIKQIHRFGTVMDYNGEYYPIKITVKEFSNKIDTNRLYTVEAVRIEEIKKSAGLTLHPDEQGRSVHTADFYRSLSQLLNDVKENF
jgi:hypothetical protein